MNTITEIAMKILLERNCSEKELRGRLKETFFNLPEIESKIDVAIMRLHELNLINDRRLADSLAQRYAHKGNCFIIKLLRLKGVCDKIISDALASLENEYERAMELIQQKSHIVDSGRLEKNKANLIRFLVGRGFSLSTIRRITNQLVVIDRSKSI